MNLDLVSKDKDQVFLLACPGNIPFSFALHPWFVINRKGQLSRWEILFRQDAKTTHWGHLHKDFTDPFSGLGIFPYFERHFSYTANLLGVVEGPAAEKLIHIIES